jgi:hypothetical protein
MQGRLMEYRLFTIVRYNVLISHQQRHRVKEERVKVKVDT